MAPNQDIGRNGRRFTKKGELGDTVAIQPARTIEELEFRANEVHEQERAALRALAACVREVAVRLPVESRLPIDLAKTARTLDRFSDGHLQSAGLDCAFGRLTDTIETYLRSVTSSEARS